MTEIPQLIEKLKSEGDKIVGFFSNLADPEWNLNVYTDGSEWTIRNILVHFVTAERAFLTELFPNVLAGHGGAAPEFSIDRFNASQQLKSQNHTNRELVDMFISIRAGMIEWVANLKEDDLKIIGRHPFLGRVSLEEMIKTVYIHNLQHYRDIKKVIRF